MIKALYSLAFLCFIAVSSHAASPATYAEAPPSRAVNWQLGSIAAATPVREELESLNLYVHYVIIAIAIFVMILLGYIMVRFKSSTNPTPARFSHNTLIEVVWTVVPIFILVGIAIPSLRTHYFMEKDVEADMTIKVTGHQWYWSYAYPDNGNIAFDSYIKKDPVDPAHPKPEELQPGELRLLEVDNRMVVPVDATVRVLLSAADVIHSWAVPAFGVKKDAVPGRLNETWFKATRTGVFYGQCSELCGTGHGFMPIAVEVVTREDFDAWVKQKQQSASTQSVNQLTAKK